MLELYAVNIDKEIDAAQWNRLLSCVSEEKIVKLSRFRRSEDAKRTLLGEALARAILAERLNLYNSQLLFGKGEYGKPYLVNIKGCHFNISHSGSWVVAAVDDMPIGADIEEIRPVDLAVAEHCFTKKEREKLGALPNPQDRLNYFYKLWTLKESYLKNIGKGFHLTLNDAGFDDWGGNTAKITGEYGAFYCKMYESIPGYVIAVCSGKNLFPCDVTVRAADCVLPLTAE